MQNIDEDSDHLIVEMDQDGNEYVIDLDVCKDHADAAMNQLWESEGEVENFDFNTAVFALFLNSIHVLSQTGWTTSELVNAVQDHSLYQPPADELN